MSGRGPEDEALSRRSGTRETRNPLVAFLYELMRDHVTVGEVERLVRSSPRGESFSLTNGWLADYARDVAERLAPPEEP